MTAKKLISLRISKATEDKLRWLAERHGTQTEAVAVALDRLYESDHNKERPMDFTKYVHTYEGPDGSSRYAVGEWDDKQAQYHVPHDTTTARATGCSGSFSRTAAGLPDSFGHHDTALRRARYLFYEMDKGYHDMMAENIPANENVGGNY